MMKTALFLALVLIGVSANASDQPRGPSNSDMTLEKFEGFPRERLLSLLTNQDVFWQGGYLGLEPYLSPNAEAILSTIDEATQETLRSWLKDPNRFVIAHVLLTLSYKKMKFSVSASEWNTLRVKQLGNGRDSCDPTQMESLQRMWAGVARDSFRTNR